jgi:hypothetical protein
MKCFTAQQPPYCCVGIGRDGLRTRRPSPGAPQPTKATGSNEVFPRRRSQVEGGE